MSKTTTRLAVIRDGEIKLMLPAAEIKADGTIWQNGCPLLDGCAEGGPSKDDLRKLVQAKRWASIPPQCYSRLGTSPSGMLCIDAREYEREQDAARDIARREYERTHPGAAERRAISDLYAKAERRRDASDDCNTMDYFSFSSQADARLKAWRAQYPAEAMEEDAQRLRSKADRERSLASGALAYDADGWLSSTDQQQRHDEHIAKAEALEREAADLLTKSKTI